MEEQAEYRPPVSEDSERIKQAKQWRKDLDVILQEIKHSHCNDEKSQEKAVAANRITEGIMWLGMELKRLGAKNPYPQSYNPENDTVEPTADNLKL